VRSRSLSLRNGSVSQDWRLPLFGAKSHLYIHNIQRLETAYSIFSVTLDEALGLRRYGHEEKAQQILAVAPALCQRLAHPLRSLLLVMLDYAKHFGVTPNLAPLNVQNFQHARSQRVAMFDDLLSRILLTRKSQFNHKLSALADLIDDLGSHFQSTVEGLASGHSDQIDNDWDLLDAVHYDLNTCLRETVVLLKSFLHALPEAQLSGFDQVLQESSIFSAPPAARPKYLAHRRIAFLKGQ